MSAKFPRGGGAGPFLARSLNSLHQESLASVKWQGQLSESYVND